MQTHKTYTVDEARKKLESYCAYQERCHKDVVQKLQSMHMIPEAVDSIVVHLLQHNFLNEERFAKAYAGGKFRIKKWGRNRIIAELKQRDISKTIIDAALKTINDADYLETFHALADKKVAGIKESNVLKKKKKLTGYLLYRGWESHLVYEKIQTM